MSVNPRGLRLCQVGCGLHLIQNRQSVLPFIGIVISAKTSRFCNHTSVMKRAFNSLAVCVNVIPTCLYFQLRGVISRNVRKKKDPASAKISGSLYRLRQAAEGSDRNVEVWFRPNAICCPDTWLCRPHTIYCYRFFAAPLIFFSRITISSSYVSVSSRTASILRPVVQA